MSTLRLSWKTLARYAISLLAAIAIFAWLYRRQDFGEMFQDIAQADFRWVLLSMGISLLGHWSRGLRWSLMLRALGYRTGWFWPFGAVMVAYLANLVLPRMGEISRCAVLQRTHQVPFNVAFGAVITERVIDLLMLLLFTGLIVLLEFNKLGALLAELLGQPTESGIAWWSLLLAGMVLLGLLMLFFIFRERVRQMALYRKVLDFLIGLKAGLLSIRKLEAKQRWAFVGHTLFIWVIYYYTTYVLFFAMPSTASLDFHAGLALLAMSGLSIAVPVQGGIGVYHFLVSRTLMVYGIAEAAAMPFAFMAHSSQVIAVLSAGGLSLLVLLFRKPAVANVQAEMSANH
jgi:uncharacterized protein (TIRG00374 family)